MDEVFGYVPPTAAPPAKKPILTILKQARAFGVGMVLATQNPVDLDYKAISNAGTWMIGRLQTERDLARLSDGLRPRPARSTWTPSPGPSRPWASESSSSTPPPASPTPTFTSRWALDYLAGPLTKGQLASLPGQPPAPTPDTATSGTASPPREGARGRRSVGAAGGGRRHPGALGRPGRPVAGRRRRRPHVDLVTAPASPPGTRSSSTTPSRRPAPHRGVRVRRRRPGRDVRRRLDHHRRLRRP